MNNPQYFIKVEGQQIPVTEDVYRAYQRPKWAEHKRQEREKRCRDQKGNRCTGDCSTCKEQRTGYVLPLNTFTEAVFEVADSVDIAELVADKLLFEELTKALESLDPDNQRILELFSLGKSEREIAATIGLSQRAIHKRKTKLFAQLQERLQYFL